MFIQVSLFIWESIPKTNKTIEDQGEKLNFSREISKLNQIKDLFSDNELTNLIKNQLKEIIETLKSIEINYLNCSSTKKN